MTRRLFSTAAALALGAATPALAQVPTLTISVYGIAQDEYKAALYDPFEAICGCRLVVETGNSSERLAKLEANRAAPVIDVAALSDADAAEAAQKGLIQPIDPAAITNLDSLYDFARDPVGGNHAIGYTFYGTSIVYRSDEVSVDSWLDLFSDELRGRVALPNITTTQGPLALYMIERAAGGESDDFDTAIAMVAEHRDDIVTFYERGSQIPQLLQQEEILAAVVGRFGWSNILRTGLPVAWAEPAEGQTGGMNVLTVVEGTEQAELAHQFIDFWLSTEVQTRLAEGLIDSPVNTTVTVSEDIAEGLTYGAETAAAISFIPPAVQLEHRNAWIEGWNNNVAR
ncbi:ABC transporter substrate-binding protein [Halodurantibacterium flavum]|uniref:ABC transporter substrate-binding protein n=1 Tax=Halodurantibacterium flavum TaxID=1382802 RepID=A0ABW4S0N0_9RHOB